MSTNSNDGSEENRNGGDNNSIYITYISSYFSDIDRAVVLVGIILATAFMKNNNIMIAETCFFNSNNNNNRRCHVIVEAVHFKYTMVLHFSSQSYVGITCKILSISRKTTMESGQSQLYRCPESCYTTY